MKMGYGKGSNVKVGCYGSPSDDGGVRAGNGKFDGVKAVAHSHRAKSGVPNIKGKGTHHGSKKTGKSFG